MLVLSRKVGESIKIGDGITIVVNRISGNRVTLGLQAPKNMRIIRGELTPFDEETPARDEEPARKPVPVTIPMPSDASESVAFLRRRAR